MSREIRWKHIPFIPYYFFKRGSPFDMYLDYNAFNKYIYTRDNSKDLE